MNITAHTTAVKTARLAAHRFGVASILCAIVATPHVLAQTGQAPSPATALPAPASADTAAVGVNPMTGRPLSEEELHRQLSKSKLVTQLGQEQVKQAQNAADLALATLRQEAEKIRLRSESLAQAADSATKTGNRSVTVIKPAAVPAAAPSPAGSPSSVSTAWPQQLVPQLGQPVASQPAAKASGTIKIGDETLPVSNSAVETAQVQWVDSQTRQVARAGSPLQPINVQPATGVLGIPAIPGITGMAPTTQGQ